MKDYCELSEDFYSLMSKFPKANSLINKLEEYGELLLFGGAVREYVDSRFSKMPRDFDIVINKNDDYLDLDKVLQGFNYKKNRFNGYKIIADNIEFDIWALENTWAFKENMIKCPKEEYKYKLQDTVFLNVDSAVYNLTEKQMFNKKYEDAMDSKEIDVVLEENPYKELNIVRAIVFKNKYRMEFSKRLREMINSFINDNEDCVEKLYEIQYNHYLEYKVNKIIIENEIRNIMSHYYLE